MRLVLALLWLVAAPLWAQTAADFGVQVEKPAGDGVHFSIGSGVWLGDQLVLTAAHVVQVDPGSRKVTTLIDGIRVDGELAFAEADRDLALIRLPVEQILPQRRQRGAAQLCPDAPPLNRAVMVAAQGAVTSSVTVGTAITSGGRSTDHWTDLLATGYHHGASGGGVFDPARTCLWGIIRLEMSGPVDGHFLDLTAFVPPEEIRAFLADFKRR
jgi:hypothetical protein